MARQVLSPIDLRTAEEKRGLSSSQRNLQAITEILGVLGQGEQIRRERQQLDRIATAVASGSSIIEAIKAAADQGPDISKGLPGILQRVGGAFQPPTAGGGIQQSLQQAIIGQALKPKPLLSREEQRDVALFGKKKRAGEAAVAAPSKQQKQRDRDLKIIGNEKASEFQKKEARTRIDADPSQPRNPVPTGGTYDEFLNSTDRESGKFGKKAHDAALIRVEDDARLQGLDPAGVKKDFERWWDERVENERTGVFGGAFTRNITIPRAEFQEGLGDIGKRLETEAGERVIVGKATTRNPGEAIDEFLKRTGK